MIAVALVAGVGSFVDWRKEIAFVDVKLKQMEKNVVSIDFLIKSAFQIRSPLILTLRSS